MTNERLNIHSRARFIRYIDDHGEERFGVRAIASFLGGVVADVVIDLNGERVDDPIAVRDGCEEEWPR